MKAIQIKKEYIYNSILFFVSIFLLIIPALQNGYPLLFSDSGTYLVSGQTGYVPIDRPIIYGLFVRHISLSWSVWLVIIMQSIIFNYILLSISRFIIKAKKPFFISFLIALFLSLFTGIGYYCSLVIADIFTSISILSLFLLVVIDKKYKIDIICLTIILMLSVSTHLSHIPITFVALGLIFLFSLFFNYNKFKDKLFRFLYLFSTLLFSLFLIALINFSFGYGFKISRTNNIILATRLIENGLANKYLLKNCNSEDFNPPYKNLCNYVNQFYRWPAAGYYLYEPDSPLYDGDCGDVDWTNCWLSKNEAYGQLIEDVLSDGELRKEYIALAISGTLKQLITFEQSRLDPVDMSNIIKQYYTDDLYDYNNATQTKKAVEFLNSSLLEAIVVDLSFLLICFLLYKYWRKLYIEHKLFVITILGSILFNAFFCSILSNVIPRYQGRVIFLIPLLAIVLLCVIYKNQINRKGFFIKENK